MKNKKTWTSPSQSEVTWNWSNNDLHISAYGLTETSPAIFVGSQNEQEYSSVGKPLRSTYAKVVKSDGSIAASGEPGEICIKGPQVTLFRAN